MRSYIKENVLDSDKVSFDLKVAYRRTFGLSIIQLEVGDRVFDLENEVANFDGFQSELESK